jgi:hypothetical protein
MGTDCTGSCKSMTSPLKNEKFWRPSWLLMCKLLEFIMNNWYINTHYLDVFLSPSLATTSKLYNFRKFSVSEVFRVISPDFSLMWNILNDLSVILYVMSGFKSLSTAVTCQYVNIRDINVTINIIYRFFWTILKYTQMKKSNKSRCCFTLFCVFV